MKQVDAPSVTEAECAEVFGGGEVRDDPAEEHPDQEPRMHWLKAGKPWRDRAPAPLTAEELAQEAGVDLAGLGERRAAREQTQAAPKAEPPQVSWEERAARATAGEEKKVRAASKAVREAQRSLRKAERAYYREAPPDEEDAQDGLFDAEEGLTPDAAQERDLRALLGAQQMYREARDHLAEIEHAAPLTILREATAGWAPPVWAWGVLALGVLVIAGPLVLLAAVLFFGLPVFAFLGALRM